jgi:hypothetical protein
MSYTSIKTVSHAVNRQMRNAFSNYSVYRTVSAAGANSKEVSIVVRWKHKGKQASHTISSLVVQP